MTVFAARAASVLLDELQPAWMRRAACVEKAANRATLDIMFVDELAMCPDPDDYRWPEGSDTAMKMCAGCPVRRKCLEHAYAIEGEDLNLGFVGVRRMHRTDCEWMTWPQRVKRMRFPESAQTPPRRCRGCRPEPEQPVYQEFTVAQMPMGVWGGVPGRVRERLDQDAADAWFVRQATARGLDVVDTIESREESA